MFGDFLPSLLLIQTLCAIFVYFDTRKHKVDNRWFWIVGVVLFGTIFLPFYILLRPRRSVLYCPNCNARNILPIERCHNCGLEIGAAEAKPPQDLEEDSTEGSAHSLGDNNLLSPSSLRGVAIREWGLLDAIIIFILSIFILPVSLIGLAGLLGLARWDRTTWGSIFFYSFTGSALLVILPIWFVHNVCQRPLRDIGLTKDRLFIFIALGVVLTVPIFFMASIVEEGIVRTISVLSPTQADAIQEAQEEEHLRSADIWPQDTGELAKILGVSVLVVFIAPIGEEILFRGMIYTVLRRRGKWRALIMTPLIFALIHAQAVHFVPILLIGFILAYLFERTGSLIPAITLHASLNLLFAILWYYYPNFYT